jgi:hypothetical protein
MNAHLRSCARFGNLPRCGLNSLLPKWPDQMLPSPSVNADVRDAGAAHPSQRAHLFR